jgi:hypothetical protein
MHVAWSPGGKEQLWEIISYCRYLSRFRQRNVFAEKAKVFRSSLRFFNQCREEGEAEGCGGDPLAGKKMLVLPCT